MKTKLNAILLLLLGGLAMGCAATHYIPSDLGRGELALRYKNGFEVWDANKRVARAPTFAGLPEHVRCVPPAYHHARQAVRRGKQVAPLLGVAGGLSLVAASWPLAAYLDNGWEHWWQWGLGGFGVAVVATVIAGQAWSAKTDAAGNAVDALNYFNDALGFPSMSCHDWRPQE